MAYSAQEMRRDGINPSEWEWYRRWHPLAADTYAGQMRSARGKRKLHGFVFAQVFIYLGMGLALLSLALPNSGSAFSLAVLAASVIAQIAVSSWKSKARATPYRQTDGPNDLHVSMVFGEPGRVIDAADRFGEKAVAAGVEGEMRTAELLDLLVERLYGTTVYHGLRFPGSDYADVDHAVANGNQVFLIDSKLYRRGEYRWGRNAVRDVIVCPDGDETPRNNSMHIASERYKVMLGPQVKVTTIVLVHGHDVRVGLPDVSPHGVFLTTPARALEYIGNSISDTLTPEWQDNPKARALLVSKLKRGAAA